MMSLKVSHGYFYPETFSWLNSLTAQAVNYIYIYIFSGPEDVSLHAPNSVFIDSLRQVSVVCLGENCLLRALLNKSFCSNLGI